MESIEDIICDIFYFLKYNIFQNIISFNSELEKILSDFISKHQQKYEEILIKLQSPDFKDNLSQLDVFTIIKIKKDLEIF